MFMPIYRYGITAADLFDNVAAFDVFAHLHLDYRADGQFGTIRDLDPIAGL